jgi:hypothetical protein
MMIPKMMAQIKARSQRLPSIEAPAKRKLRNIREVVRERTAPHDASKMHFEFWRSKILREHGELPLGASSFERINHEEQADRRTGKTAITMLRRNAI